MARTVLAVALNAAIDKTLAATDFQVGQSYVAESVSAVPGGKAINLARALRTLGGQVRILGFVGGPTGEAIRQGLDAEGLTYSFTAIEENSRTCWAVRDPLRHTSTEVNEAGPTIRPSELADLMTTYRLLLRGAGVIALSGSLPRRVPPDIYAEMITEAWDQGIPCTLDTGNGEALALGLAAGPLLVKPNGREAAALAGHPVTDVDEAARAAQLMLEQGALLAAVTLGPRGAVLCSPRGCWHAAAPAVTPVNTVGSGDSFLAGFLSVFLRALPETRPRRAADDAPEPAPPVRPVGGRSTERGGAAEGGFLTAARDTALLREALRIGTAAGTANALSPSAGLLEREAVARCAAQVTLTDLAL